MKLIEVCEDFGECAKTRKLEQNFEKQVKLMPEICIKIAHVSGCPYYNKK